MYLNVSIYKHNKGKVMAINGHDLTSVRFSAHLCGSTAWLIVYSKTAAIDRTGICIFIAMWSRKSNQFSRANYLTTAVEMFPLHFPQPWQYFVEPNVGPPANPLIYFTDPNLKITISSCVHVCVRLCALCVSPLEILARAEKVQGIEGIPCMCLCGGWHGFSVSLTQFVVNWFCSLEP